MMEFWRLLTFCCGAALVMQLGNAAYAADRTLVADGQSTSAILLDTPSNEFARRAANELIYHVVRATGAAIPTVDHNTVGQLPADHTIVVIGAGDVAASLGVSGDDLREEEFLIQTRGRHLVFAGSDTVAGGEGGGTSGSPATQWAVGYFLDRHMGVRWLWPGELGTFVPQVETVIVPDLDFRDRPEMASRIFRPALTSRDATEARRTNSDVREQMIAEVSQWNARHQMGVRQRVQSSHSFRNWWDKYHEEYPDIFATLPEGMTQPNPKPDRVKLCVSNPRVEELILTEWREAGRPDVWSVSPNDGQGYCVCEDCRALDIPHTLDADPLDIFWNRSVVSLTGRYLHLWRRLLDTMREENPDVALTALAYANYRLASPEMEPLEHENALHISLVPDNWSDREYQSLSEWQRIGATIIMRPNFAFVAYAAPYLPLHNEGRFWEHAVDTDIIGWFSNLLGYWGTQGPRYYMVARLCARPDLGVEEVLDEYTSGFGDAAPAIRDYLDYWEEVVEGADYPDWAGHFHHLDNQDGFYKQTLEKREVRTHPFWGSWYIQPFLYTDERLAKGRAILDRAEELAGDDRVVIQRIEFLRDGLKHLELTRDVVELANAKLRPKVEGPGALQEQQRRFKRLLVELKNFRSRVNPRHVVWADSIVGHEIRRTVRMSDRYADAWAISSVPPESWSQWEFRKDSEGVGLDEQWYAAGATDAADWAPIEVPGFWHDTSVGDYQGYGWYRTTFQMPGDWEYDTVKVTFEAVDEQAWVYFNGEYVGEHTLQSESSGTEEVSLGELCKTPFTIDIPVEQANLGQENSLVVRVHNKIGAGGIQGRVLIQQPTEPLFVSTEELGDGIIWEPDRSYTNFRMARMGSGRADVTLDETTHGVIMEAGADGGGWALYVDDGRLYFQCGKGNEFRAEDQSVIEVPIEPGRHVIEWSADAIRSKAMVRIDGNIVGISEQAIYRFLAGNDPGGIGQIHNVMCRNAGGWYSGDDGDFTGTIHSAVVWPDMVCF